MGSLLTRAEMAVLTQQNWTMLRTRMNESHGTNSRHVFGALHARKSRSRVMSLLPLCWGSRMLQKRRRMRRLLCPGAYGVVQASDEDWFAVGWSHGSNK